MIRRLAVILCLGVTLSGCGSTDLVSTLSANDNWAGLALYDVEHGIQSRTYSQLEKLGLQTENQMVTYLSTYSQHLDNYCKPDNAFLYGLEDHPINNACVQDTLTGKLFFYNWEEGKRWQTRLELFLTD